MFVHGRYAERRRRERHSILLDSSFIHELGAARSGQNAPLIGSIRGPQFRLTAVACWVTVDSRDILDMVWIHAAWGQCHTVSAGNSELD